MSLASGCNAFGTPDPRASLPIGHGLFRLRTWPPEQEPLVKQQMFTNQWMSQRSQQIHLKIQPPRISSVRTSCQEVLPNPSLSWGISVTFPSSPHRRCPHSGKPALVLVNGQAPLEGISGSSTEPHQPTGSSVETKKRSSFYTRAHIPKDFSSMLPLGQTPLYSR